MTKPIGQQPKGPEANRSPVNPKLQEKNKSGNYKGNMRDSMCPTGNCVTGNR